MRSKAPSTICSKLAFIIALVKQKFLVIGIGGPVGDVLRRFHVSVASVLSGPGHRVA